LNFSSFEAFHWWFELIGGFQELDNVFYQIVKDCDDDYELLGFWNLSFAWCSKSRAHNISETGNNYSVGFLRKSYHLITYVIITTATWLPETGLCQGEITGTIYNKIYNEACTDLKVTNSNKLKSLETNA
jgi:hypothetical protein